MRVGCTGTFCNCLINEITEHFTEQDEEGCCVYCGYHVIERIITKKDTRMRAKNAERMKKLKMEALDVFVKDKRHNEKVN